jgi:hypothetical protein
VGASHFGVSSIPLGCTSMDRGPGVQTSVNLSNSMGASHFGVSGIPLGCTSMDRGPGVQTSTEKLFSC